jgi:hypothetical protein
VNTIIDISDWNIKKWIQTTGTRDKYFVENPINEKVYFFKESIEKYPSEFWSEILASKIGKKLGFPLLDYNIGILGQTVGCICESMIDQKSEELEHGINLIKKAVPTFKITNRPLIIFNEVEQSFIPYSGFLRKFIEVLIFDSIIGNQDRHSENWAIIRSLDVENINFNKKRQIRWLYDLYKSSGIQLNNIPFKRFFMSMLQESQLINIKFSPIYDSGSSLGREIPEHNIHRFLNNDSEIEKYIKNGRSEVRWDGSKINHFGLLAILKKNHESVISSIITRTLNLYNENEILSIINVIDEELPQEFNKSRLSLDRKKLIAKFIDFRIRELRRI